MPAHPALYHPPPEPEKLKWTALISMGLAAAFDVIGSLLSRDGVELGKDHVPL